MRCIKRFSISGLYFLQNALLFIGFGCVPFLFFVNNLGFKLLMGVFLVSIFKGFRLLEKTIHQKEQIKKANEIKTLKEQVKRDLKLLEHLFTSMGLYHHSYNVRTLGKFYQELSNASSVQELLSLRKRIESIAFSVTEEYKAKTSQPKEGVKKATLHSSDNMLAHSLRTLGLSEDTTDMLKIKNAYKTLIKTYHPDVNSSSEATQKFIKIHEAFKNIKKHIEVS